MNLLHRTLLLRCGKKSWGRWMHYGSQGHTLFVDVTDIPQPLQLDVVAKWQENAEIIDDTNSNFKYELVSKTSDSKCWYLKVVPTTQCHVLHDRASLPPIVIPELFNLRIEGHNLNISIKNKVMGDIHIKTMGKSVMVDKIKGTNITFDAKLADIKVTKVVEGGLQLNCNNLTAKMINGESIALNVSGALNCDAMYASQATIQSSKDVKLSLFKGNLKLNNSGEGNIAINGVDGSLQVHAPQSQVEVQINNLYARESSIDDAKVEYKSSIFGKSIRCLLDPEIRTVLSCKTSLVSDDNIDVDSDAFHVDYVGEDQCSVVGSFSGVSAAVKRPRFAKAGLADSGKVDLRGSEVSREAKQLSKLELESSGKISIQTMSWIQVIRRRHGFVDDSEGTLPPSVNSALK